jgi:tetratricopeptide (TPR) repeat protein
MNEIKLLALLLGIVISNFSIGQEKDLSEDKVRQAILKTSSKSDTGFIFLLTHMRQIKTMTDVNVIVIRRLGKIIFQEEIVPYFTEPAKPIIWKVIAADLQRRYSDCDDELINNLKVLFREYVGVEIIHTFMNSQTKIPDEKNISKRLRKRFPGYDFKQLQLEAAINYYEKEEMWKECENAARKLLKQYSQNLSINQINQICWFNIFMYGSDKQSLQTAIHTMEKAIGHVPKAQHLDTYANMLYKNGDVLLALDYQKKAKEAATKESLKTSAIKDIDENFDKINSGKKTWIIDIQK